MQIINWKNCDKYLVHGDAEECALIGPKNIRKNICPKPPGISCADGISFFNHAALHKDGVLEIHTGDYEEIYYIIHGNGKFTVDDEKVSCRDGDAIYVPAGITHGMINTGNLPLEYLILGSFSSGL